MAVMESRPPGLERLARLGVRYENATTPHPLCVPARVAMWTAMYPHRTGCTVNRTPMPRGMPHAARWWKEAGYELALLGKNHCFAESEDYDLFDVWCEIEHYGFKDRLPHYGFKEDAPDAGSPRGMDWVESEERVTAAHAVRNDMPPPRGGVSSYAATGFEHCHYGTGLLSNQADAYLRRAHERPFVLWLSLPDPHVPYETPKHFFDRALAQQVELPPPGPVPGADLSDAEPDSQPDHALARRARRRSCECRRRLSRERPAHRRARSVGCSTRSRKRTSSTTRFSSSARITATLPASIRWRPRVACCTTAWSAFR